jgi:Domain of unknown function (DUF4920)
MFKRIVFFISIVAIGAISCNKTAKTAVTSDVKKEISEEEAYQKFKGQANKGKAFGEKIDAKGALAYDAVLPKIKKLTGADKLDNVKLTGTVEAVCKAKGCWMNIASQNGEPSMFVQFKDYGFFMPKDLAGKKVVMQGYAFKEVTDVATLRHLAADEGKSKAEIEKITKPREDYKFLANGVLILD